MGFVALEARFDIPEPHFDSAEPSVDSLGVVAEAPNTKAVSLSVEAFTLYWAIIVK